VEVNGILIATEIKYEVKRLRTFLETGKQYTDSSVYRCKISNATNNKIHQNFVHSTAKDASYTLCLAEQYHITLAQHSQKYCVSVYFGFHTLASPHASRFPIVFLTRWPASFDIDLASFTEYPAFDGVCRSAMLSGNAVCSVTSSCVGQRSQCPNSLCLRIHFKAVFLKAGFLGTHEFREGV
jgi:hypothetical protein